MIQLNTSIRILPSEIIDDLNSGKIHLICAAQNGLTHLNVYAELYLKLPKDTVNSYVDRVNSNQISDTLYPIASISIIPYKRIGSEIERLFSTELESCVNKIFEINESQIKAEIIYFSLESSYIRTFEVLKYIERKIHNLAGKTSHVKEIWFSVN
jgi:hypothetical protein